MSKSIATVPAERIEQAIFLIRGERVMLDFDLATLYQVTTKALNRLFGAIENDFQRISCFS